MGVSRQAPPLTQTVSRLRAEKEVQMPTYKLRDWRTKEIIEVFRKDQFCQECGTSMNVIMEEGDMRGDELLREWITYKCPNKKQDDDLHKCFTVFTEYSQKSNIMFFHESREEYWYEKLWRRLTQRAADETYCACKRGSYIYEDEPAVCPNCLKPFRR